MTYFDDTPANTWNLDAALEQYLINMNYQRARDALKKDLEAIIASSDSTEEEKGKARTLWTSFKKDKAKSRKLHQQRQEEA